MLLQPVTIVQLESVSAVKTAAEYISKQLTQYLKKPLLLLLSGGSAIDLYKVCFELLHQQHQQFDNLTVSLVDERYVPKNHPDSNETQLREAGVIKLVEEIEGKFLPFLTEHGESGERLAQEIDQLFSSLLALQTQIVVLAGIGDDGHTSGLLPTQDENTIEHIFYSKSAVEYYDLPQDTNNPYRHRLTTTPYFLSRADRVIAYSTGEKKKTALTRFLETTTATPSLPSSFLRTGKNPVVLLTDLELAGPTE